MRLARYAIAFGLGYAVGHPDGREKLRTVPGRVNELAHRPEAEKLRDRGKTVAGQARDRGKTVAGQAVQAAKQRIGRGGSATDRATDKATDRATNKGSGPAPVVAEETVVATETDVDTAMHGSLPPTQPGGPRRSGSPR